MPAGLLSPWGSQLRLLLRARWLFDLLRQHDLPHLRLESPLRQRLFDFPVRLRQRLLFVRVELPCVFHGMHDLHVNRLQCM